MREEQMMVSGLCWKAKRVMNKRDSNMKETRFIDTEIGKIPEDWEVVRLGDKFSFISNNTLSRDFLCQEGNIKNIHYGDVLIKYGSTLDVSQSDIPAINADLLPSYNPNNIAKDGDVIIADTAEDETVCKVTELWNIGNKKVVSGLHTMWCRPKENNFAMKFLGYFMNSTLYHNQVLPLIQGIKVASVSKNAIRDTWLCIPPIKEQHRIASALTSIDNLISSLNKLIEKKKNIKQGAMQQLLTGKKRLKGFNEPWVEKKLGDMFDIKAGGDVVKLAFSPVKYGVYKYPIYSNSLDNYGLYGYTCIPRCPANSITITGRGTLGHAEFRDCEYDAVIRILILTPKIEDIDCNCIASLINYQSPFVFESTGVPQLTIPQVIESHIILPFSIIEQRAIANLLSSMDKEISSLKVKITKYERIKQGMMQQLLTGKIRLINALHHTKEYPILQTDNTYSFVAEP